MRREIIAIVREDEWKENILQNWQVALHSVYFFSSVQIVRLWEKSLQKQARPYMIQKRMAMTEKGGIIAWLLERNCQELLQEIFLYLDPESLHNSRQVCQQWNDFITESVWGSQRGHRALERRLHNNWLTSEPRVLSVDYTEQMFFHHNKSALALDNKYLVAGLSHVGQGGAKLIDLATQEVVAHLPHQDSQDRGVRSVMITQSWIITQGREKAILWSRDSFQQVLALDLTVNSCLETEGGLLYFAAQHHLPLNNMLSLYKLKTDSMYQEFTPELIFEREGKGSIKFGTNKDIPVLVNERLFETGGRAFLIDQIHETEEKVEVMNPITAKNTLVFFITSDGIRDVIDYSFKSPHLAILTLEKSSDEDDEDEDEDNSEDEDTDEEEDLPHKIILKVFNIERSTSLPLYSIDIDEIECPMDNIILEDVTILVENNLIRVSTPGKIFVLDSTTIEDGDSVLTSMTEILMDGGVGPLEESLVLFNKFLGVRKQQDTITYYNFWK